MLDIYNLAKLVIVIVLTILIYFYCKDKGNKEKEFQYRLAIFIWLLGTSGAIVGGLVGVELGKEPDVFVEVTFLGDEKAQINASNRGYPAIGFEVAYQPCIGINTTSLKRLGAVNVIYETKLEESSNKTFDIDLKYFIEGYKDIVDIGDLKLPYEGYLYFDYLVNCKNCRERDTRILRDGFFQVAKFNCYKKDEKCILVPHYIWNSNETLSCS